MNTLEVIQWNFAEIRRRSEIVWRSIPQSHWNWKPDNQAFSCIQMIRHVLEGEHLFHVIIQKRGNLGDYVSPWKDKDYLDIESEIEFASTSGRNFLP